MGFLFKNGDELYDQAVDLVGRKDFSGARNKFNSAIEKGCGDKENYCRFCIALINVGDKFGDASRYKELVKTLQALPAGGVTFGVTTADRDLIIAQAEAAVKEIEAQNMSDADYMAKGQAYIAVASEYAVSIGDANLPIQEMLKGTAVTGSRESLILQATAYEIMGKGAVYTDPKQGSEYLQMAYNFRRQIGDSGEEDLRLMKNFAITAKCWLCGKQVAGMGVHFMSVRSQISGMFRGKEEAEPIRSSGDAFDCIYMCMPCYSAISNRADEISRQYFDQCMEEIRLLNIRMVAMEAEIQSLRFSVSR